MWHIIELILSGIILGWGAAIPIGPMNLEMMRRNLVHGTRFGIGFGLGACSSDVTYLVLLSWGVLALLNQPHILKIVAMCGVIILIAFAGFALKSIRKQGVKAPDLNKLRQSKSQNIQKKGMFSPIIDFISGYVFTMVNAYTILFWITVSAQVAAVSNKTHDAILWIGLGLILGTTSWVFFVNILLHYTRHKFSQKWIVRLNIFGAILLILFAVYAAIRFL